MSTPPPTPSAPKTPGLAITSLVCGIAGFLTCLLTGIPAIITGHLALGKINRDPGRYQGSGTAMTGLVLRYVTTAATILIIPLAAMATPAIYKALERATMVENTSHARELQLSLHSYASSNSNQFPADLTQLETSGILPSLVLTQYKDSKGTLHDWLYYPGFTSTDAPTTILLASPESIGGTKRIVAYLDGTTLPIPETDYQSQIRAQKTP